MSARPSAMLRERKPLGGYRHRLGSRGTQTMDQLKQRYLSLLPDLPRWVETRDLLSFEGSVVAENATRSGFVIWSEDDGLGSVVGEPNPEGVVRAADCVSEILAFPENVEQVRTILHDFRAESATVFSAPAQLPPSPPHPCRRIGHVEIASLQHLPTESMDESIRRGPGRGDNRCGLRRYAASSLCLRRVGDGSPLGCIDRHHREPSS